MYEWCSTDLETRSVVDLKAAGVYKYAESEHTDVLCMSWAFDDEEPGIWFPWWEPFPEEVAEYIARGGRMRAWNAAFERTLWREIIGPRYRAPVPAMGQWFCTAASAAALGLPRALEQCGQALRLPIEKDMAGNRLMMQMCKPRKARKGEDPEKLYWFDDTERMLRLGDYCKQDVRTERAVCNNVVPLTDRARAVYMVDQRINDRGIRVDLTAVAASKRAARAAEAKYNERLAVVTCGEVTALTQVGRLTQWITERGVDVESLNKEALAELLAQDLPEDVREALLIRQEGGKTSVKKLDAIERAVCADGRIRGTAVFHGAATGRFAAKIVQHQNLPSPPDGYDCEGFVDDVIVGDLALAEALHGPLILGVSYTLRQMLTASPGNEMVVFDYKQIEARILAWLAGETWRLEAFRLGRDIYIESASRMFGIPYADISKSVRKKGKVAELALGYQGGVGALKKMGALAMGLAEDELDDVKTRWREANPNVVQFWYDLDNAARRAIKSPGSVQAVGRVKFVVHKGWLWLRLPSGRRLAYCSPHFTTDPDWGEQITYWGVDGYTKKWCRQKTYGGTFCENICQAVAADILWDGLVRLDAEGFSTVLHVHDEAGLDEPDVTEAKMNRIKELLCTLEPWADGLPLDSEGDSKFRYRKD
jgi:DNA polymerase